MNRQSRGARFVDLVSQRIAAIYQKFVKKVAVSIMGLFVLLIGLLIWWLHRHPAAVFTPHGQVASQERSLLFVALLLSVLVVVPVFALTIGIVLKYRETNEKPKKYQPEWDGSRLLESVWWGIPGIIIIFLSVITWTSSHTLDPYRTIASKQKPLYIQVVSLDWKWLFIYPEQHIATVNYLPLPVNTPISFDLTSGSVMNSFWVPQLGSQIYTMPGMSTQLHMLATKVGDYAGSSANISGKGFADMTFKAHVISTTDFQNWAYQSEASGRGFDAVQQELLMKPAVAKQQVVYRGVPDSLYEDIMMPFMTPMTSQASQQPEGGFMSNPDGTIMNMNGHMQ